VLFARAARLGRVKTRLQETYGQEGALLLHRALVADSRALLRRAARCAGAVPYVAWSDHPAVLRRRRAAAPPRPPGDATRRGRARRILRQGPGDLGARLRRVIRRLLEAGHRSVVVIGSDSPTLPAGRVARAAAILDRGGADLVLGPARDGGYYLIGLRDDTPGLFARMPWGGATLCARTLARARRLRLRVARLDPWYDVDRPADLERLSRDITGRKRALAPRTAAVLARLAAGPIGPGRRSRPGSQPT
jgi:rSAM/selenodomain-associated transferase 1